MKSVDEAQSAEEYQTGDEITIDTCSKSLVVTCVPTLVGFQGGRLDSGVQHQFHAPVRFAFYTVNFGDVDSVEESQVADPPFHVGQ
ncbi:MAG: hypothetical protein FWD29_08085 [Micrococcales bacterium]|nr:hypothetical protein [Micrococcales bacterium]